MDKQKFVDDVYECAINHNGIHFVIGNECYDMLANRFKIANLLNIDRCAMNKLTLNDGTLIIFCDMAFYKDFTKDLDVWFVHELKEKDSDE